MRKVVRMGLGVAVGLLAAGAADSTAADGSSTVQRVGGSREAVAEARPDRRTGEVTWVSGPCRIETPLPEGYAPPTPPGAIDLKSYPVVRRAVVSGDRGGFWPLFRHIQRRDIAMTSPVEIDHHGLRPGAPTAETGQSMAFLYRRPDQGPIGADGPVEVRDSEPMTVLAAGVSGPRDGAHVDSALRDLTAWLAAHPEWEVAGDVRALHYNGPMTPSGRKWGEVQVPVRRVAN